MKYIFGLNLITLALLGASIAKPASEQPVLIYLHSRIADQVNIEMSEDRLRRVLPLVEKYRKQRPESGGVATVLFSGAFSEALVARNSKTGIKDFVQDFARRGIIELGYDGTDEPTYARRPRPNFVGPKTAQERWLARVEPAGKFLTEWRDPLTGVPNPNKVGGLKIFQEIFGEAACIVGMTSDIGGDSELVHQLGRLNTKAVMFGFPDPHPDLQIHGYRGSVEQFGRQMSPVANSSPELYWQDNVLRSADTSDAAIRKVVADEGPDALKAVLAKIDRSRIRIVHVELGALKKHLRPFYRDPIRYPPLMLAYDHPEAARLRPEALMDADAVNAAYAKEEALIRWLVEDFFPKNKGSRFLSSSDLRQMTPDSTGFTVSLADLKTGLSEQLKDWENTTHPPPYMKAGGRYLSLADEFQVTADVLAELSRTGKLPSSVHVTKVYGPIEVPEDHGPNLGEVTVASVARVCADLVGRLHDQTWKPVPVNAIPSRVKIDGFDLNAAQFLRLMAEAIGSDPPQSKLKVKMTEMFSIVGEAVPKTRLPKELGVAWTFKPAPLTILPAGGASD
jgi:hypothetical protein